MNHGNFSKSLTQRSLFFKALRLLDFPKLVGLIHNVVAVCLEQEGFLN